MPFKKFSLRGERGKAKRMPRKETPQYKLASKLRCSTQMQRLRQMYLRRHPLCQDCANRVAVEVHHIMPVAKYPELCFDECNLRALCIPCHQARHNKKETE